MLPAISLKTRRNILLVITALVVAYVRTFLQYHRFSWDSFEQFLISWFIHYIAVLGVVIVSFAFIRLKAEFFLGSRTENQEIAIEEAIVYVSLVLLVVSVLTFFLANLPAEGVFDYE